MEDALASKPVFVGRNYLSAYRAIADWKSQFEDAARTLTIIVPKDALAVIDRQKFAGKVIRTDNNRGRHFSIVHWLLDNPEDKAQRLEFNGHHSLIGLCLRYFGRETKLCGACYSPDHLSTNCGERQRIQRERARDIFPARQQQRQHGQGAANPRVQPGVPFAQAAAAGVMPQKNRPGAAGAGQGAVVAGQRGNGGGQQQQQREGLAANRGADLTMAGFVEIMRADSKAQERRFMQLFKEQQDKHEEEKRVWREQIEQVSLLREAVLNLTKLVGQSGIRNNMDVDGEDNVRLEQSSQRATTAVAQEVAGILSDKMAAEVSTVGQTLIASLEALINSKLRAKSYPTLTEDSFRGPAPYRATNRPKLHDRAASMSAIFLPSGTESGTASSSLVATLDLSLPRTLSAPLGFSPNTGTQSSASPQ
ncbi:hypothetical protein BCR44DRAFT_1462953 [Catenaria anguillulae PL171]|uniref:Uncharacterized protein n=1 Tax=Catenaria anguillulae PL171 TaxID=765915 RepID=A0A1Y2HE20_9FUNG|nr:hypothetical protein BCR44DRAFT_1462953 [Catenaria anguillulae PL171]